MLHNGPLSSPQSHSFHPSHLLFVVQQDGQHTQCLRTMLQHRVECFIVERSV